MKILVTGNMGYVGPVVVQHLRSRFPKAELIGFDTALFTQAVTTPGPIPEACLDAQHFGDIRDIPLKLLDQTDAVVHLAAISNDPMGNRFEAVTDAINHQASTALAVRARAAGVKRFIFASSCSVYGAADGAPRRERDAVVPLTSYARSKIATERALATEDLTGMTVTALRFATACGMSPRLRLDLVLNDFVANALVNGEVVVLSDGTPWRPLINVRDMALAIEWAIIREGDAMLVVNAGSDRWNYTVRDLADAVAAAMPGTNVSINTAAPPDKRSYKVDFSLFATLAPDHQPKVSLHTTITELINGLRAYGFADRAFRNGRLIRLHMLAGLIESGQLSADLRWLDRS